MSTGEIIRTDVNYEQPLELTPTDQLYRGLGEIFAVPDELYVSQQLKLAFIIARVAPLLSSPLEQQVIADHIELQNWLYSPKVGMELPKVFNYFTYPRTDSDPSIIEAVVYRGGSGDRFDSTAYTAYDTVFDSVYSMLEQAGIERIREAYSDHIWSGETMERMQPLERKFVEESQAMVFLRALEGGGQDSGMQPLTPFWEGVRASQIEATIRTENAMQPAERLQTGTAPHKRFMRETSQLNEEEMPVDVCNDDPVAELRRCVSKATNITEDILDIVSDIGPIKDDGKQGVEVMTATDAAVKLLDWLGIKYSASTHETYYTSRSLLRHVIDSVYIRKKPWSEALSSAVTSVIGNNLEEHTPWLYGSHYTSDLNGAKGTYQRARMMQSPGSRRDAETPVLREVSSVPISFYAGDPIRPVVPESSIEAEKAVTIGIIKKDDRSRATSTGASRLILPAQLYNYPRDFSQADLIIELTEMSGQGLAPNIPGFRLISWDGADTFGLKREPGNDPYAMCHIPLPAEAMSKLADKYHELGMLELAEQILAGEVETVAQLAREVQRFSDYTYHTGYRQDLDSDRLLTFRGSIANGRLQTQCSGATKFLQASLNLLFADSPQIITQRIGGYTLPTSGAIVEGAAHGQLQITDGHSVYILDSTPADPEATVRKKVGKGSAASVLGDVVRMFKAIRSSAEEEIVMPQQLPQADTTAAALPLLSTHSAALLESPESSKLKVIPGENLRDLAMEEEKARHELDKITRTFLGSHEDKELGIILSRLHPRDPLRRALVLANRKVDSATLVNITEVAEILGHISNADPQVVRRAGWEVIPKATAEGLQRNLQQLGSIIAERARQ